ncbi:hypothetical protein JCM16303_002203 [Sporobolomyces ruberrimus]
MENGSTILGGLASTSSQIASTSTPIHSSNTASLEILFGSTKNASSPNLDSRISSSNSFPIAPPSSASSSTFRAQVLPPTPVKLSEKALGKRPENRIRLQPTKSAALSLLSSKSRPSSHRPTSVPIESAEASTFHTALQPHAAPIDPSSSSTTSTFFAPNGRSLRARTFRPSYLEIPPSAPGLEPPTTTSSKGSRRDSLEPPPRGGETALELLKVSGKVVKRFKKWAKDRRNAGRVKGEEVVSSDSSESSGEEEEVRGRGKGKKGKRARSPASSLSSLSSDTDSTERKARTRGKNKTKRQKRVVQSRNYDRDSSPLSSLGSSPEPPARPPRVLAFPSKPASHPLNRTFHSAPQKPPIPPNLDVFKEFQSEKNPFNWAEGLREITLTGELVEPTFEEDLPEEEILQKEAQQKKKRPGWEWEVTGEDSGNRSVSPSIVTGGGSSLAHPPTTSSHASFLSVPTLSTFTKNPSFLGTTVNVPPSILPRPKTYRQIAKLDWSDFHQRNKCRFTTSGAIEGVNPEGLPWETWYGVEDEYVAPIQRTNTVDPGGKDKGLVVFGGQKGLDNLMGIGHESDFERVKLDAVFEGGMEWLNEWRYKTLEEGMGRAWESQGRWAARNPERKYMTSSSEDDESEVESYETKRARLDEIKRQRKREKKKAKREKARKEREGSGGESELTPFEGEELSTDSDETEGDDEAVEDAASIARSASMLLQEAAETHATNRRKGPGVMIQCPFPNCPQRLYRSKASSSAATHNRHYHTPSITIKYSSGISAYITRDDNGDFVCPGTACGFKTKSRGTFAVHGKPAKGNCRGPSESQVVEHSPDVTRLG